MMATEIFEIIIHGSKNEAAIWEELESLNEEFQQAQGSNNSAPKVLYVTILGSSAILSTRACERLLQIMRYFDTAFPGHPSHLRLLRVDQQADWCHHFLSAIEKEEGALASRLDLELHTTLLHPVLVRSLQTLLRENKLKQLRIDTTPFTFGGDPSHRSIISALAENKSLECIWLDAFYPPGGSTAIMTETFLSKPNLRTVSLREPETQLEIKSLQGILSHPMCPIEDLTIINHSSFGSAPGGSIFTPWLEQARFFELPVPNQSVKTFRLLRCGGIEENQTASILSSFHALEELYIFQGALRSLPILPSTRRLGKYLRVLDLSASNIVNHWEHLGPKGLVEVYGSLLQYKLLFPQLRIHGFPANHRIFRDYPSFISEQKNIPAALWPTLFELLSILANADAGCNNIDTNPHRQHQPLHSPDHCFHTLQRYLSHQACGLVPSRQPLFEEETCCCSTSMDGDMESSTNSDIENACQVTNMDTPSVECTFSKPIMERSTARMPLQSIIR